VAGLVGLGLCLTGCTDTGPPDPPTLTADPGPFDPPSRFDLERAVDLPFDDVLYGTLDGTVLYSITGGALRSTDLLDAARSWSVDLPGDDPHVRMAPVVVDGTVLLATGHPIKPDDLTTISPYDDGDYMINLVGVDIDRHQIAWELPLPAHYDIGYEYIPAALVPDPDIWFDLDLTVRDDGVLLAAYSFYDFYFATLLLDPATGQVRWQVDTPVLGPMTGRYAMASAERNSHDRSPFPFRNLVVLDLSTGQVHEQLDPSLTVVEFVYSDANGESYASFRVKTTDPPSFLRLSTTDGTVQPFVPAADDIRYDTGYCRAEPGQAVMLCRDPDHSDAVRGVDRTSGRVVWTIDHSPPDATAQFHGYVYAAGWLDEDAGVFDLNTGKTVHHDTGLSAIAFPQRGRDAADGRPIMVNEYGAVGWTATGRCVWAPASG